MIHYIENEFLRAGVKELGCELTSIISKETGYEYLWQGSEEFWTGQSPILFPIVGRLIDDEYRLDSKTYTMPKHGFARKLPFALCSKREDSVSFILRENEETLRLYPYAFELIITFTLEGRILKTSHKVVNKNNSIMYFSLGAHPAFNCQLGDKLIFDEKESLDTVKIDLVHSLRLPDTVPVLREENEIVITKDIFNEDALIFSGVKSECVTLASDSHDRTIRFNLGAAPYLGIWAKPGAPYVCIEPWCGVNDSQERKADFSQKDGINALEAGSSFLYTWWAEFSH